MPVIIFESKPILLQTWIDMNVTMKNTLMRSFAVGDEQVHTVTWQIRRADNRRDPLRDFKHVPKNFCRYVSLSSPPVADILCKAHEIFDLKLFAIVERYSARKTPEYLMHDGAKHENIDVLNAV